MTLQRRVLQSLPMILLFSFLAQAYPYEDELANSTTSLVLEGIIIRGNWNVTDDFILNQLDWVVGDPFNEKKLAAGQTRLEATEMFREVELSTRRGNEPGAIIVVVRVREKRLPYIDWFEVHQYVTGYTFNIVELETFTQSRRNHLVAELSIADPRGGLFLDYTNALPWSTSSRLYLTGEVSNETWSIHPLPNREGFDQDINRFAAGFGYQYRSAMLGRVRLGGEYTVTDVGSEPYYYPNSHSMDDLDRIEDPSQLPPFMQKTEDTNWSGIRLELLRDNRDDELYPHDGSLIYVPVYAASDSKNQDSFFRISIDARSYIPLGSGTTIALRGRAGILTGDAPYYQRFSLTQGSGLRGIGYGWVDPPKGGTRMLQGSFEIRRPLTGNRPDSFINLLLFSEIGANWHDDTRAYLADPDYSDLKATLGWGLAFRLPVVGPLALYVAYPVMAPDEAEAVNVNVRLGMAF